MSPPPVVEKLPGEVSSPRRWTKSCRTDWEKSHDFAPDAPPPTSFEPPKGSDVVPRKIFTPTHHYLSRARKPSWSEEGLAQPPRIYVDQKTLFREISNVTQLRRGDHCMITLNVLRCLSPSVDYMVSLMGSLELSHLYHHFTILEDVACVDEYGVPRTKEGDIATIMEYSNTIPEFYEEVRVKSFGSWLSFPHVLATQLLQKAQCHRVPLADYGDMPHIFRMEEKLSEEDRNRIVASAEQLLVKSPKYHIIWANCEHTTNMVSAKQQFTSPEVHFMIWSSCRYILTALGLAFLHFVTMQCYSRYCLQTPFWALSAYYTCTALPLLAQILVQYGRLAWTAMSSYWQNVISRNDLYHLLIKELCRAIFNGAMAFGFILWAPDVLQFAEGKYPISISIAVVFAYITSDMIYALLAQVVTRIIMARHGHWWLLGGSDLKWEEEMLVKSEASKEAEAKKAR